MRTLIDHLQVFFITPPILLRNSFLPMHRQARKAHAELRRYLEDVRDIKTEQIRSADTSRKPNEDFNLADLLVGAGDLDGTVACPSLPPSAVLGNIFVFMFAGHESSSNTLLFVIVLLACHPAAQRNLQGDIDRIIGACGGNDLDPADKSSYLKLFDTLSQSMVGAVINEAMRLFTVLPFIAKCVPPGSPAQPLKLSDGQTYTVPANTLIPINTSAIHRHPQYWPGEFSTRNIVNKNPAAAFNPYRWLPGNHQQGKTEGVDHTSQFLHPAPGTYIPFPDGIRGCIGKKFAFVELVALVTRIFSQCSVELPIDKKDLDETKDERASWDRVRARVERELYEGVTFQTSLKLTNKVKVVFVKRGKKQYRD